MGKLNKQTFKHFIESECERRLFLELGEEDHRWLSPLRSMTPRTPNDYDHQKQVLELGHDYEEEVYRGLLRASPNEVRHPGTPVMVGRIVADIDAIVRVVRLPGWKMTPEAGREPRRALIKTLSKYKSNEEQGLVAKVFSYIEQPTNEQTST